MSTQIVAPYITGKTAYAIIRDNTGQAWNTSGTPALEAWQDAHWSVYAISTPEQGTASAGYAFTVPALPAGNYSATWYEQQGVGAAIGDAGYAFATDEFEWDGAALVTVASRAAVGSAMTLDLTQAVPTTNTAQTVGDALNAARAQGFGKWTIVGTTLTLFAADGTTAVRTFTLDSATTPTSRT